MAIAGLGGHVLEASIPPIAIEAVGLGRVTSGSTVVYGSRTGVALLGIGQSVVHVVAHEKVQPTVSIVIQQGGTHAPRRIGAVTHGDLGEGAVAVVPIHSVLAEVGDVEVDPAIVVDVPRRRPHSVAERDDSALRGHVGKAQVGRPVRVHVQIVSKEPVSERRLFRRRKEGVVQVLAGSQHLTLHQVDVQIAVVVVVEEGAPGPHHFAEVILSGHSVEVAKVDSDSLGDVLEKIGTGVASLGWVNR